MTTRHRSETPRWLTGWRVAALCTGIIALGLAVTLADWLLQ